MSAAATATAFTTSSQRASIKPISIIVRLRPFLPHEAEDDTITFPDQPTTVEGSSSAPVTSSISSSVLVKNLRDPSIQSKYAFAAVHPAHDSQEHVFQSSVSPFLGDILHGKNLTLFAYGVTGSGKTWTMVGESAGVHGAKKVRSRSKYSDGQEVAGEAEGLTPRLVRWLMSQKQEREMIRLGKKKKARSKKGQEEDERKAAEFIDVELECYEIYNEMVFDLLVKDRPLSGLPVRENGERKVFVAGLTSQPINNYADFLSLFELANSHRSIGSTNLNTASSRSHMIISLIVQIKTQDASGKAISTKTSRVNLVDLAGSENNKLTGNTKERMTESSAINKSLFVLGQVVQALNTGATRIPYRDSKMTMIMRDALGGGTSRSHGVLIANLAPGAKFYNDTVATLNFAGRTKTIENRVGVNQNNTAPPQATASQPAAASLKPLASAALARSASQPKPALGVINGVRAPLATKNSNIRPVSSIQSAAGSKPLNPAVGPSVAAPKAAPIPLKPGVVSVARPRAMPTVAAEKTSDYSALEARLESLEKRLAEQGAAPSAHALSAALPALLSPATRNKTAKAAISLARVAENQGGVDALREALGHYEQALLYAPENERLSGRIKECREAIALGVDLKKLRARKKREIKGAALTVETSTEAEAVVTSVGRTKKDPSIPRHLDIEVRMLGTDKKGPLLDLPLPPSSQKWRISGDIGDDGSNGLGGTEQATVSAADTRPAPPAQRKRAATTEPTTKAQRVKRKRSDEHKDSDDSCGPSRDDDGDGEAHVPTAEACSRQPVRRAAVRARKKSKEASDETLPSRELSPIRGDSGPYIPVDEDEEGDNSTGGSTFARTVSRFAFQDPSPNHAVIPAPVPAKATARTKGKRKTSSTDPQAEAEMEADAAASVEAMPKAKRTRKAAATAAPAKRRSKTPDSSCALASHEQAPASPCPAIDLSSIPLPTIRPLVRCPFCAIAFAASRSGPAKLKHLNTCATSLRLSVGVASELVASEAQRLAQVAAEERRREEEARTLLEVTIKDKVVVRREVARRARNTDGGGGEDEVSPLKKKTRMNKAAAAVAVGGCEIQSPSKQSRQEVRRKAEQLLRLAPPSPRSAAATAVGAGARARKKGIEEDYDFDPTPCAVSEREFVHSLLSQRPCSTTITTAGGKRDDAETKPPKATQAFQPSSLAQRYATKSGRRLFDERGETDARLFNTIAVDAGDEEEEEEEEEDDEEEEGDVSEYIP
ncbi:hypothetical protein ACQY0O_004527 [Thecaphora frezii]